MESAASLAYGPKDLPSGGLPLRYHAHLPSDLPWAEPEKAAKICAALLDMVTRLGVQRAVLHPPVSGQGRASFVRILAAFLRHFVLLGNNPAHLLLENIRGNDLCALLPLMRDYGLQICLDMGHVLGYRQTALAGNDSLLARVDLVHLSAPGSGGTVGRHLPLTAFSGTEAVAVRALLRTVPETAVIMLELFDWSDITASLPLLRQWLSE